MFLVPSCSCFSPIYWSHVLSREWRCSWSSADRRCSNYIWVIDNLIANEGAPYIRDLTVICFMTETVMMWTTKGCHRQRVLTAGVMCRCVGHNSAIYGAFVPKPKSKPKRVKQKRRTHKNARTCRSHSQVYRIFFIQYQIIISWNITCCKPTFIF